MNKYLVFTKENSNTNFFGREVRAKDYRSALVKALVLSAFKNFNPERLKFRNIKNLLISYNHISRRIYTENNTNGSPYRIRKRDDGVYIYYYGELEFVIKKLN